MPLTLRTLIHFYAVGAIRHIVCHSAMLTTMLILETLQFTQLEVKYFP